MSSNVLSLSLIGSTATSVLGYLYYFSVFFFILFIFLFFINSTIYPVFSFMDGDGGLLRVPTTNDSTKTFTDKPPTWDISGTIPDLACSGYTIALDVYLQNAFGQSSLVPKVFLYQSKQKLTTLSGLVDTPASILTYFSPPTPTTSSGDSNLIVWFDALVNDMKIGVVTSTTTGTTTTKALNVTTVQNIPLNTPFRLGIVFSQEFLEIYINGKLEKTTVFRPNAQPISIGSTSNSKSKVFGPIQPVGVGVQIGNLYYWPYTATPTQMQINGSVVSPATFFTAPAR